MNKKILGSYYTPQNLAKFVTNYCANQINKKEFSILEPSVGDGNFVESINNYYNNNVIKKINLTIVEKENEELIKAKKKNINKNIVLKSINDDYLNFHFNNKKKFNLIIGNPPYVKSNLLKDEQKDLIKRIHNELNLSNKKTNNIWTAFLVSSIIKLEQDGILAFILPLELLQVKFTEELRELLKKSFERLEIFMFNELQFLECKGQDTVLLIGYKKHKVSGTFYTTIKSMEELLNNEFILYRNKSVSESNKKWTHHFISSDEYVFLEKLKKDLKPISEYVNNKAGIVTAANNYFIVNEETLEKFSLNSFSKPIVQKGVFVNGSVSFNKDDYDKLIYDKKPAFLLDFNKIDASKIPNNVKEYLIKGEEEGLQERFKCKQRIHWYKVPNIATQSKAFFFKRAHEYPKLLKNEANVFVTDSAYNIEIKDNYRIDDFIFSFYNSLTLTFSELEGRYYGGGVLELTPNEFRVLPLPYNSIDNFNNYKKIFKSKKNISELLSHYNHQILNSSLNLSNEEINKIELIRNKLINKRQKKDI
ncbi:N-6 DNA methylase [uncultured Flavobacterium sp.]|jgi:adenine-specific DNA-methyltransferase|uniref:Eco57I restriction-modification methylase domain-containing protein n=1 Tax=uncultured Flavobacterium sp. TaxID=165435 RepID=UPI0030C8B452